MITYMVQRASGDPIKIGRTTNLVKRVDALETGAGERIVVLAVMPGNREPELHERYASARMFREWFSPTPEVLAEARRAILDPLVHFRGDRARASRYLGVAPALFDAMLARHVTDDEIVSLWRLLRWTGSMDDVTPAG